MPLGERVRHDLGVTFGACKSGGLFFCCPQVEVDKDISIRTSLELIHCWVRLVDAWYKEVVS